MMRVAKLSIFLASAALASTCICVPVRAAMLTGVDDPEKDIPTLQGAADAGGHYVLAGTFNLGEKGRIRLTRDITFEGEGGPAGAKPLVRGGDWAFLSPLPFSTVFAAADPLLLPPITAPGPRIVIRGLDFDGPTGAAVHIAYASHLEVTGNRIRNVHRSQLTPTFARHAGVDVGTQTYLVGELRSPGAVPLYHLMTANGRRRQNSFIPGAVTGEVTIAANVIEVDPAADDAVADKEVVPAQIAARSQGYGVFLGLLDGAMVQVSDNAISGAARAGIAVADPRVGPTGAGSFVIENNRIVTPRRGTYSPNGYAPNGVEVGWIVDPAGGADAARNVPPVIRRNRIEMNSRVEFIPSPTASHAISAVSDRSVIEGNLVTLTEPGQLGINVSDAGALVRANKVEGPGLAALRVTTLKLQVVAADTLPAKFVVTAANGNAFIGNNISRFVPTPTPMPTPPPTTTHPDAAHIHVLAYQGTPPEGNVLPESNVFTGNGGKEKVTVLDQGRNTIITGYAPVRGGLGKILHETLQEALIEPAPIPLR